MSTEIQSHKVPPIRYDIRLDERLYISLTHHYRELIVRVGSQWYTNARPAKCNAWLAELCDPVSRHECIYTYLYIDNDKLRNIWITNNYVNLYNRRRHHVWTNEIKFRHVLHAVHSSHIVSQRKLTVILGWRSYYAVWRSRHCVSHKGKNN